MRVKPTPCGHLLVDVSDEPLTEREKLVRKQDLQRHPESLPLMADLAKAAGMGLKIEYSKSPAFIGLLVVDVVRGSLPGFSAPQVQVGCEDDKVRFSFCQCLRAGCERAEATQCQACTQRLRSAKLATLHETSTIVGLPFRAQASVPCSQLQ